jgi:transposase
MRCQEAHLARRPLAEIVDIIDRVVQHWLDPQYPYRQQAEALLPTITHYSLPMIRHGLDTLLPALRRDALWRLLYAEFGDPLVLDTFRPRAHAGGFTRAYGPRLITHIFSGNVPALSAWSLVCALLTKSASLGKSASEEPVFAALFARSCGISARPRACVGVSWWKGGDSPGGGSAHAEAVIATRRRQLRHSASRRRYALGRA